MKQTGCEWVQDKTDNNGIVVCVSAWWMCFRQQRKSCLNKDFLAETPNPNKHMQREILPQWFGWLKANQWLKHHCRYLLVGPQRLGQTCSCVFTGGNCPGRLICCNQALVHVSSSFWSSNFLIWWTFCRALSCSVHGVKHIYDSVIKKRRSYSQVWLWF